MLFLKLIELNVLKKHSLLRMKSILLLKTEEGRTNEVGLTKLMFLLPDWAKTEAAMQVYLSQFMQWAYRLR